MNDSPYRQKSPKVAITSFGRYSLGPPYKRSSVLVMTIEGPEGIYSVVPGEALNREVNGSLVKPITDERLTQLIYEEMLYIGFPEPIYFWL